MKSRKTRVAQRVPQLRAKAGLRKLANSIEVARTQIAYAVPYFTRDGADTEYLISNPNTSPVKVRVGVVGQRCRIVKIHDFKLGPHCTRSIRVRADAPENAGHSLVVSTARVIIHLLYLRRDAAVSGAEQAGRDNLFSWNPREKSRTYGFGYRALALGHDTLNGAVFVSNPHNTVLTAHVAFFDQECRLAAAKRLRIKPGCTAEGAFPKGRFGHGCVTVSHQAVVNVLHFAASTRGIAAAELIGEADLIDAPCDVPARKSKILFDDTHSCRAGLVGDWTSYEAALVAAGYTVTHYTATSVTLANLKRHDVFVIAMARQSYTSAEQQAISQFVSEGGGLLVVQDFGNAPWSVPTREILNLFGANDDNNTVQDPTNHFTPGNTSEVVFDYQRNFLPHPIVNGWKYFHVSATASLSGTGWTTVVETDDDSTPIRQPVLLARSFGAGRVVAFGDSNTWADHAINDLENKLLGIRCEEWLLFRI
jgi:hypothetical protein